MRKIICSLLLFCASVAQAQTFPVNNLLVNGTATFVGQAAFQVSPTGPTPNPADNSTKLATTAFVTNGFIPLPTLAGLAPIASPVFTGVPAAPTAAIGTNSTQLATTSFIAQHSPCPSIMDHGGINTGTGDNTSAFNATIAVNSQAGCVFFPAGTYSFAGQIGETLPSSTASLMILGAGVGATTLQWSAGGGGIAVVMPGGRGNSIHFRDFSMLTGVAGGGTAISLGNTTNGSQTQPTENSDITNVSIHGLDGYGLTDYWTTGININAWSAVNLVGIQVYGAVGGGDLLGYCGSGTGVIVQGGTGTISTPPIGVIYNIQSSQFNCLNVGVANGNNSQGVTISQSNFTAAKNCITTLGVSGLTQETIIGNQFNCSDSAYVDNVGLADLAIIGNTILVPNQSQTHSNSGISLLGVFSAQITGNSFYSFSNSTNGSIGVVVGLTEGSSMGAVISGNTFMHFVTAVALNPNSTFNNVQGNLYSNNTNTVVNGGTNNSVGVATQ